MVKPLSFLEGLCFHCLLCLVVRVFLLQQRSVISLALCDGSRLISTSCSFFPVGGPMPSPSGCPLLLVFACIALLGCCIFMLRFRPPTSYSSLRLFLSGVTPLGFLCFSLGELPHLPFGSLWRSSNASKAPKLKDVILSPLFLPSIEICSLSPPAPWTSL